MKTTMMTCLLTVMLTWSGTAAAEVKSRLLVGAAAVDLPADDDMVIGGGIFPWKAKGQEGKLRAIAVVLKGDEGTKLAIIACDVLMIERDILDAAAREIEAKTKIPFSNILINCTHTHSAPTTCTVHGYEREEGFTQGVKKAIVESARQANEKLAAATFFFRLGEEATVGQNSRLLLSDGTIFWTGSSQDAVRPTGPFDPELPVLSFRRADGKSVATIFNHSTHTIGARLPGKRSPAFYGLAAQELEDYTGGVVMFLEGASGSTHNLFLKPDECVFRIKNAVADAYEASLPMSAKPLASIKREIDPRVRMFDELKEDKAVRDYCFKRYANPKDAEAVSGVFLKMRRSLAPRRGQVRKTWVQSMRIGDVAIVGVPGEFFTKLGVEIKRRSPFRYTYVAELANDWVGYIQDKKGFDMGGYQVWTGYHSYVAQGTGEQIVDEAVRQLEELQSKDR